MFGWFLCTFSSPSPPPPTDADTTPVLHRVGAARPCAMKFGKFCEETNDELRNQFTDLPVFPYKGLKKALNRQAESDNPDGEAFLLLLLKEMSQI